MSTARALAARVNLSGWLVVVGLVALWQLACSLGWMPAGGFPGWDAGIGPALKALLLPAVSLALAQAGVLTRVARTSVIEVMREDFVRTARAKGLSEGAALWRHALPNALIPVVTMLGLQFTFLVAGAVLVENVFNLPGLGRLAFQALSQRDATQGLGSVIGYLSLGTRHGLVVDGEQEIAHWRGGDGQWRRARIPLVWFTQEKRHELA